MGKWRAEDSEDTWDAGCAEVEADQGGCDRKSRAAYALGRMNSGLEMATVLGHSDSVPSGQLANRGTCFRQVPLKTGIQSLLWRLTDKPVVG